MAIQKCVLNEAIIRYPLIMQNSTVSLAPMPLSINRTIERVWRQSEDAMMGSKERPVVKLEDLC